MKLNFNELIKDFSHKDIYHLMGFTGSLQKKDKFGYDFLIKIRSVTMTNLSVN